MAESARGGGTIDDRLLLLAPEDNVLVARTDLEAGDRLIIDGAEVPVASGVPVGFKIARKEIAAGEKIYKYGAAVGSATCSISKGQVVHLDNMKSDYLPTYTLDGHNRFIQKAPA